MGAAAVAGAPSGLLRGLVLFPARLATSQRRVARRYNRLLRFLEPQSQR